MTGETIPADNELFDGGPPRRLKLHCGWLDPINQIISRAAIILIVVWVPLILLASIQSLSIGQDKLTDYVRFRGARATC